MLKFAPDLKTFLELLPQPLNDKECITKHSPPPDRGDIGGEILFEVDERNFDG